ncbi:MAG: RpiB/LacA/LacB family sugar-phosphate isomerase, partial [Candidatus Rokuibacteriota bacterium]
MRIAIGCDDTGFPLKESLVAALEAEGHDVLDLGTFSTDPVDYPDYARAVGQAVLRGFVDASLLLCASGAGGVIAANKMRGIRAALCHDPEAARQSREEVDTNVLCLAASGLDAKTAIEIAQAFIGTEFQAGDPGARQVTKIGQLEAGLLGADKAPLPPGDEKAARTSTAARPATPK